MNILLAEDDAKLGQLVERMLTKKGGYHVEWVQQGDDAYEYALASHFDILILDWMMPVENGISVCKRLRNQGYSKAILMLTAKDTLEDRVQGLDAGADDYLVKPFEFEELLARVRALARRNYAPIQEELAVIGNLRINRTDYTVLCGEKKVQLTPREFQLLDLLVQNKGQVLTREIILDRIWGFEAEVSNKAVDAMIKLIRKKLEVIGKQNVVQSVRGVGYKIEK